MRLHRVLAVPAVLLAVALAGCGSEPSPSADGGTTPSVADDSADTGTGDAADRPALGTGTADGALGREVLNQRLAVPADLYPLPDAPTEAVAGSAAELGERYAAVPGIEDVVRTLEQVELASDERLFAYLVNACTTEDTALRLRADELVLTVKGTAGLRCPPPTTMVVWAVGDEVPADVVPGRAVQE